MIDDDINSALNRLQRAINVTSDWLTGIGLALNPLKSKCMLFTRKRYTALLVLKLENINIPWVTENKFLILIFDAPYLTWCKHINQLLVACNRRLNIMRSLCCSNWGYRD